MDTQLDGILHELRAGLKRIYGERLVEIVLYGSRARGDADPDSDIDVLIVLRDQPTRTEQAGTSKWISALCLKHDVVVSEIYMPVERYRSEKSPLVLNIMREGVAI